MDGPFPRPMLYREAARGTGPSSDGRGRSSPAARYAFRAASERPCPKAKARSGLSRLRRPLFPVLLALLACSSGCVNRLPAPERTSGEVVEAALRGLSSLGSFPFLVRQETRVGVSGYTAWGEERGEGVLEGEDFTVEMTRISPQGEERYAISFREGGYYLRREGTERPAEGSEVPGPLLRPHDFIEIFSKYKHAREGNEEDYQGLRCRVFDLEYDPSLALQAIPEQAKEYFSNLDYSLQGKVWLGDGSPYPVAMSLVLIGLDRVEKLQRLRLDCTLQPFPGGKT